MKHSTIFIFKFIIMPRTYKLERSKSTGNWHWACNDGSAEGWSTSKSEAKSEASEACGIIPFNIDPPPYSAAIYRGYLAHFTVNDLHGNLNTFSVGEISEDQFNYFFGLEDKENIRLSDIEKVIACLTIWGIYKGGKTIEVIRKKHNLTPNDIRTIADKAFDSLILTIDDKGQYKWKFKNSKIQ